MRIPQLHVRIPHAAAAVASRPTGWILAGTLTWRLAQTRGDVGTGVAMAKVERGASRVPRILVVDDEEGVRSFLAEALEDAGHAVAEAAHGDAAAERLRREAFDLLITDLRMPGLHGLELVRIARAER